MAKEINITQKIFTDVKEFLDKGLTIQQTAKVMDLSAGTVSAIKKATSLDHYYQTKQLNKQIKKKAMKDAQKAIASSIDTAPTTTPKPPIPAMAEPKPVQITLQATHFMDEKLTEMNKTLTLIANKMSFMMEALSGIFVALEPEEAKKFLDKYTA